MVAVGKRVDDDDGGGAGRAARAASATRSSDELMQEESQQDGQVLQQQVQEHQDGLPRVEARGAFTPDYDIIYSIVFHSAVDEQRILWSYQYQIISPGIRLCTALYFMIRIGGGLQ